MFPDKHTWEAEYFIEQGFTATTYQVAYVEVGTTTRKHLEEYYYVGGYVGALIEQFSDTDLARKAAIEHANMMSEKRSHGKVLVKLGKLP